MAVSSRQWIDHYDVLGVRAEAPFREVEEAYWRQANDPANRDRLAEINAAYEVLGDTRRREAHDAGRAARLPESSAVEPPADGLPRANPGLRRKLRWYLQ